MSSYFRRFAEKFWQNVIVLVILIVAIVFICISVTKHEIWLDEAQHFLLAKNSRTYSDLLDNMRYESHPPLWNFLLKSLNIATINQLKLLHLAIAALVLFTVALLAPFSKLVKSGLIFSYFFSYEYSVISRNYGLSILFILLATSVYTYKSRHLILIALLLGLSALTHIYAGVIGAILFTYIILIQKNNKYTFAQIIPATALLTFFGLFAIWTAWPQHDHFLYHYHSSSLVSIERLSSSISLPFKVFFHFPDVFSYNWWNTNLFFPESNVSRGIVALTAWSLPLLYFVHKRKILLVYFLGAVSLTLLLAVTPMPLSLRHGGFFLLLFICCLWIDKSENKAISIKPKFSQIKTILATLFFIIQIAGTIITYHNEWNKPFSNSKAIAEYFLKKDIKGNQICVYPHYSGPAVSAYMNDSIYYAERNNYGSFTHWGINNFEIPDELMLERCAARQQQSNKPMYIVASKVPDISHSKYKLVQVIRFNGACVQAENYTIYTLTEK